MPTPPNRSVVKKLKRIEQRLEKRLESIPEKVIPSASETGREVGKEVLSKMTALSTAAFGIAAAFAWNSAIQSIFDAYYPAAKDSISAKIMYAMVLTSVAVLLTMWLGGLAERKTRKA